ncbi:type II secretion system protein GspJ [Aestuariicoccus sp. MJ-SS9]|uniref:type II secretion system protein GspJ n=1 Tax=Aestuariicoccus sp. MJ-SS9 TaxID=3079855 RepID=UPI002915483D|nr:type II secretion system protein GspJ [Aestuariicoccus sp. MJ-SS9]MDU8912178.1 type II secretion system protein GspJ [Aestuariicoccus sp. MJ-SS9]
MRRDRGLTLIELVAAMAVFALIAVMGLQALTGSLRMRDALASRAEAATDLALATALLRQDLSGALPMLFFPPGGAPPRSAMAEDGAGFALSRGGLPGARIGRVEWRLSDGALTRRVWPTLTPASPAQKSPAVPVLDGIAALSWRSHWPGAGWVPGLRPPAGQPRRTDAPATDSDRSSAAPESYSDAVPQAVELTLITRDFGTIVMVESLK